MPEIAPETALDRAVRPLRSLTEGSTLGLIMTVHERASANGDPPASDLAHGLNPSERLVFDLLILGLSVAADRAEAVLGRDCLDALVAHAVLRPEGAAFASTGLRLRFLPGRRAFAGDGGPRCYVHFGHDTLRFCEAIGALPAGRRGLELCAGGASPAMALAARCEAVTAVEICEPVSRVARLNVALNGLSDRVQVRQGDLWSAVSGERFDRIVANPPFSPSEENPWDDPAAVAGPDGLDVARAIWGGARRHLAPDGTLLILLGMLGDADGPHVLAELESLARAEHLAVAVVPLEAPRPLERLQIPRLQNEPIGRRIAQIRGGAARTGASHYHIALLSLRLGPPEVVRVPLRDGAAEAFRRRARAMRAER